MGMVSNLSSSSGVWTLKELCCCHKKETQQIPLGENPQQNCFRHKFSLCPPDFVHGLGRSGRTVCFGSLEAKDSAMRWAGRSAWGAWEEQEEAKGTCGFAMNTPGGMAAYHTEPHPMAGLAPTSVPITRGSSGHPAQHIKSPPWAIPLAVLLAQALQRHRGTLPFSQLSRFEV